MQVTVGLRIFHKNPLGVTVTTNAPAINFSFSSIQGRTNAC